MESQTATRSKCKICGNRKRSGEYICGVCDRRRVYNEDKSVGHKIAGLTCKVIHCPGGDYARGAVFPGHDFNLSRGMSKKHSISTLTNGYWVEGMVVQDSNGKTWEVVGTEGNRQHLKRVDVESPSDEAHASGSK